jgi:hypothetical protein
MIKSKRGIDLNKILQIFNIVILTLLWDAYFKNENGLYVDFTTILLGTALSLQIGIFLFFEKKKRDPFVLLLCLQMIIYFLLRILTLVYYEFSFVFQRYPFTPENLNNALIFILAANLFLYLGLTINKLRPNIFNKTLNTRPINTNLVIVLIAIGYFVAFYQKLGLGFLGGILEVVKSLFINLGTMLFMAIVFILIFKGRIDKKTKNIVLIGIFGLVLLQTLTGSRSAILTVINYLIFALLAIYDHIKVDKKYLVLGGILLPVMIVIFAVTTYLRPRLENRAEIGNETFQVLKEFDLHEVVVEGSDLVLAEVSDRIGFLDYCAETISNSDKYSSIFNLKYYFESIVDNVLTPGFTVFDTPRVANATNFIYNEKGTPSLARVAEAYQSDEFTMYGEFYALFGGWFSLIPIFFTGYFFKKIYFNVKQNNIYTYYLKRAIILYVFYSLLNSFGLDWMLLDIISIFFTFMIFKSFFKFKRIS